MDADEVRKQHGPKELCFNGKGERWRVSLEGMPVLNDKLKKIRE